MNNGFRHTVFEISFPGFLTIQVNNEIVLLLLLHKFFLKLNKTVVFSRNPRSCFDIILHIGIMASLVGLDLQLA